MLRTAFGHALMVSSMLLTGFYLNEHPLQADIYSCCGFGGDNHCRYTDSEVNCDSTFCNPNSAYKYCCMNLCNS